MPRRIFAGGEPKPDIAHVTVGYLHVIDVATGEIVSVKNRYI